jgi:hypothetical protein
MGRVGARILGCFVLPLALGCGALLGLEERKLDTEEIDARGYEGCEPAREECDACTSEWHECICRGWNRTPEAELRLDCAEIAPAAIREDVQRSAEEGYEEYLQSRTDGGADDDVADDDVVGDDDVADDDVSTDDDVAADNDVSADDDVADDDVADDDVADDDASTDDDMGDDDLPPLPTFNEDFCAFVGPPPTLCQGCFCAECRSEFDQCLEDRGCAEIMDCALTSDCDPSLRTGPGSCYTAGTCRSVIDTQGGLDAPSYELFAAATGCGLDAACPCGGSPAPVACSPDTGCTDCLGCWDGCACAGDGLAACRAECGDPNCTSAQGCAFCADCVDACLCFGGGDIAMCVAQCGEPPGGPECNPADGCQCNDCMAGCLCDGNTEPDCQEQCHVGGQCTLADACGGCTTCEGTCSCELQAPITACLGSCGSPLGCDPTADCADCGSCQAQCECETGDPVACVTSCQATTCQSPSLSPCESCSCTTCPSDFGLCITLQGCSEALRCIESTGCTSLPDCALPERCGAELGGIAPEVLGVIEALQSCRMESACPCAGTPPSVECGGITCQGYQPPPPDPIAAPCCGGMNGDLCGLDPEPLFGPGQVMACVPLNQPGPPDADCPTFAPGQRPYNGTTLEGCCRMDDTCGLQDDITGLGCVSPDLFGLPAGTDCGP